MIKNIYKRPIYLPYMHENLSDEKLAAFERKIGRRLPKSLVEILKIQNGGYIRYALPQTPPMQIWGVGERYPCLTMIADEFSPEDVEYLDFSLDDLLAFDGDGHYFHCLDYRQNKEDPQVSYVDIEEGSFSVAAKNFDEFLEKLQLEAENFYVIKSPLDEAVEAFKNHLEIKLEERDKTEFGYACYRGKYGGHYLWLSPNEVPLAFARKGANCYATLKNYEGQSALRFPEIGANFTLLNVYNDELLPRLRADLEGIFEIIRLDEMIDAHKFG